MSRKKDGKRGMKQGRGEIDRRLSAEDAATELESLARGLRDGRLTLADTPFDATLRGDVDLEISARSKKRRGRIKLDLTFRTDSRATSEEASSESATGDAAGEQEPATLPDKFSF